MHGDKTKMQHKERQEELQECEITATSLIE